MKKLISIVIMFCAIQSCGQTRVPVEGAPYHVSIIKLLAEPETYDKKRVTIMGFLHYRFEDSALYFSKDHADHLMGFDAVWIRCDSVPIHNREELDGKYVIVVGEFDKDSNGHMGAFAGTNRKVTAISALKNYSKPRRRKK